MNISEKSKRNIVRFFNPENWEEWNFSTAKSQSITHYISLSEILNKYASIPNYKAHLDNIAIETDIKEGLSRKNSIGRYETLHITTLVISCLLLSIILLVLFKFGFNSSHFKVLIASLIFLIFTCGWCRFFAVNIEKLRMNRLDESSKSYVIGESYEKIELALHLLRSKQPQVFTNEASGKFNIIENNFWGIDNFISGLLVGYKGLEIMALRGTPPNGKICFKRSEIDRIFATFRKDTETSRENKFLMLLKSFDHKKLDPISIEAVKWKKQRTHEKFPKQYDLLRNQKRMYDFVVDMVESHSSNENPHITKLNPTRKAILEVLCNLIINFDVWKRLLNDKPYTKDKETIEKLLLGAFEKSSHGTKSTLNDKSPPGTEATTKMITGRYRALQTWLNELEIENKNHR